MSVKKLVLSRVLNVVYVTQSYLCCVASGEWHPANVIYVYTGHEYIHHLPTCVLGYIHFGVTYRLSYCFLQGPFLFHTLTLSSLEQKEGSRHPGSLCYISQHTVCTFVCMFPL